MRFADGRSAGLRKAEMPDLALLNQFFNCSRHIFNRHGGVNPVLIKELNAVSVQPFQRLLNYLADMLRLLLRPMVPSMAKSNLVAMETLLRKGASASPTSFSLV